jgi:hypothetical protein
VCKLRRELAQRVRALKYRWPDYGCIEFEPKELGSARRTIRGFLSLAFHRKGFENRRGAMNCRNHEGVPAVAVCFGCAAEFCARCLLTLQGVRYCASCKESGVLLSSTLPVQKPFSGASNSFKLAVIGFFFGGVILWPIAIAKASRARRRIHKDGLAGEGLARATVVISLIGFVLWLIGWVWRSTLMNPLRLP